jgi:nucleoside-diphosphate-sugar epimerase
LDDKHPEIYGDGNQTRDFTYVQDVIQANIQCMTCNAQGVYNIAYGEQYSINQLFNFIAKKIGVDIKPIYSKPRPGDVRDSLADISCAKQYLNYNPIYNLEKGLEETIKWFQKY